MKLLKYTFEEFLISYKTFYFKDNYVGNGDLPLK